MELSDEQKRRIREEEERRVAEEQYRAEVRRELLGAGTAFPKRVVPAIDLNQTTTTDLVNLLECDEEFAHAVVEGRPYQLPEDLLGNARLHKNPRWVIPVIKLLIDSRTPGNEPPLPHPIRVQRVHHSSGLACGQAEQRDGTTRVFIEHPIGFELIGANLDPGSPGLLDYKSLRLLTILPGALAHQDIASIRLARTIVRSEGARWASTIQQGDLSDLDAAAGDGIQRLSHHLRRIQAFTQAAERFPFSIGPHHSDPPFNWMTNGCTGVPNFDFKRCCDNHDLCYAATPLGQRWLCDLELAACIAATGGPEHWALGALYGVGVLVLGGAMDVLNLGVTGGDEKTPLKPTGGGGGIAHGRGRCSYQIKLVALRNNCPRELGTVFRFRFGQGPNDASSASSTPFYTPQPGATKQVDAYPVTKSASGGRCGDLVPEFSLYVDEPERDQNKLFFISPFLCDGSTYDVAATMGIESGGLFVRKMRGSITDAQEECWWRTRYGDFYDGAYSRQLQNGWLQELTWRLIIAVTTSFVVGFGSIYAFGVAPGVYSGARPMIF